MADSPPNTDQAEMSFLDHLEVLRWHLIRSAIAIVLFAFAAFTAKKLVFDVIIFGPKRPDFFTYRLLCKMSNKLTQVAPSLFPDGAICIGQNLPELVNLTMSGQFTSHIVTALIFGLIAASPYLFFEIWRFIKPGLTAQERKNASGFVFFASLLFFCGVLFGYYVICPLSVNFFLNYQVSELVVNQPTLSTYISLVTTVLLACGAVFELPIVIFFLTKAGLITPQVLRAFRKHALVFALILSAIITPPDVFSQLLVSIPIIVLYEISIRISAMIVKKESKAIAK